MVLQFPHFDPRVKPPLGTQLDRSDPINRGLVGYWLMNEGAGAIASDLSGNGCVGTITGATWTAGQFGPCLNFDGTTDYIVLPAGTHAAFGLSDFTINIWVKSPTGQGAHRIMFSTGTLGVGSFWFYQHSGDRAAVYSVDGVIYAYCGIPWQNNIWTMYTLMRQGATVRVYGDAKIDANDVVDTTGASNLTSVANWYIGALTDGSAGFNGSIDNFQIWNRALTPSEIARLYREPFAGFQRERIVLWAGAMGGEAGPTYTGSGGASLTKATVSASATYTGPIYAATGSPSIKKATASASATFTVPAYSGSGSPSATKAIASADATFAVPVYAATGGGEVAQPMTDGSGTYTVPVYMGDGSPEVQTATARADSTFTAPAYAGSGGGEVQRPTASASGLCGVAVYTGTGSETVTKPTASASAAYTVPAYTGSGSVECDHATADADGTFTVPMYSGYGSVEVQRPTASASGLYGLVYVGSGIATTSQPTASASGTFTPGIFAIASAFVLLKRRC